MTNQQDGMPSIFAIPAKAALSSHRLRMPVNDPRRAQKIGRRFGALIFAAAAVWDSSVTAAHAALKPFNDYDDCSAHLDSYEQSHYVKLKDNSPDSVVEACTQAIREEENRPPSPFGNRHSGSLQNYLKRGSAYLEKGDYDRAIADFQEVVNGTAAYQQEVKPEDRKYLSHQSFLETRQSIYSGEVLDAQCELAFIYVEKGDSPRALQQFDNSLKIVRTKSAKVKDDWRRKVLTCRGAVYARMGKRDLAFKDLDSAIDINLAIKEPGRNNINANAYATRAEAFDFYNDVPKAIADWRKALEQDPGRSTADKIVAKMLKSAAANFDRAQYQQAIQYYDALVQTGDNALLARTLSAQAHAAAGEFDAAIADYTWCLDFDPEDDALLFGRGRAYVAMSDYARAIGDFGRAIWLKPKDPVYRISRGRILELTGDLDGADRDYREALQLRSK